MVDGPSSEGQYGNASGECLSGSDRDGVEDLAGEVFKSGQSVTIVRPIFNIFDRMAPGEGWLIACSSGLPPCPAASPSRRRSPPLAPLRRGPRLASPASR